MTTWQAVAPKRRLVALLAERVTPAVRDAVRQTIADAAAQTAAGSAADQLAASWQAAYGRNPDPVRAYS